MPAADLDRACAATEALPIELAGQWMLLEQGRGGRWELWANDPNHATEAAWLIWNGQHPRRF